MQYRYFSKNDQILPAEQAAIPLDNIAYAYGFGVYETIRVDKGIVYFADEHLERLQQSASIIGLEHSFTNGMIQDTVAKLINKNQAGTCNLKLLLVGRTAKEEAALYILCLNPLFPDRKLYHEGAKAITYEAERPFAHAKSLNMLESYIAYTKAKEADAYDALLINRNGHITEGTRTNFFVIKGRTIISPPEDEILLGVMRKVILKVAGENDYKIEQQSIALSDLSNYDNAFLTSTSSKIMPLKSINTYAFANISPELQELMQKTNEFLASSNGKLE